MPDVFDIYTIIFLALAVFIFLRLRSVLGQRTGRERPPYDPYSPQDAVRRPIDKVVPMPQRPADVAPRPAEAAPEPPPTAGRMSPKRVPLPPPGSTPLPPPIRASTASISSPARAPLTR